MATREHADTLPIVMTCFRCGVTYEPAKLRTTWCPCCFAPNISNIRTAPHAFNDVQKD
jgi:hypothetical protein